MQHHARGGLLTGRASSRVGRGDLGANRNHLLRVLEARYFFSEREYGRFQRTFRMPANARGDGVSAERA